MKCFVLNVSLLLGCIYSGMVIRTGLESVRRFHLGQ